MVMSVVDFYHSKKEVGKSMKQYQESKKHHIGKQYMWLVIWILIALVCNGIVFLLMGKTHAVDFLGGYITELSLSIDNVFVFLMIFMGFNLGEKAQHRVLAWGIIGAIILRFIFVFFGLALINRFEWVLYIFGALLIISGNKMFKESTPQDPHDSKIIRILKKILPMTGYFVDEKFLTKEEGRTFATPLLAVLVLIEASDILFAVDSVPAVFSITREPVIVYVSNILAILCIRQLYFVVEHMQERFRFVRFGVAAILIFTGVKMLLGIGDIHVGTGISIGVIVGILLVSIIVSWVFSPSSEKENS